MQPLSMGSLEADRAGLPEYVKQEIRDVMATLARAPGFKPRRSQRLMIAEIAKTLAGEYENEQSVEERVICVEGPTGTGKSLGYLLAAIPVAKALGHQLVVSTATVALQEQLMSKDLPALREAGLQFTYALAKGRRRYVCDRNLDQLVGEQDQQPLDLEEQDLDPGMATWSFKPAAGEIEMVQAMLEGREQGTWNGDLDEWDEIPRPELKAALTTDTAGCTNNACAFKEQCAFFRASAERQEKTVIVANHALVMTDLTLGGGAVLPAPSNTLYVFDEGHHLASVAIDQGAACTQLMGSQKAIQTLTTLPEAVRLTTPDQDRIHKDMDIYETRFKRLVKDLKEGLTALAGLLRESHPQLLAQALQDERGERGGERRGRGEDAVPMTWRFERGIVPPALRERFNTAFERTDELHREASKFGDYIKDLLESKLGNTVTAMALSSAQLIADRLKGMRQSFKLLAQDTPTRKGAPPIARWVDCVEEGKDFECCANPTSAAQLLREVLWTQARGAVVTSATLAALGRFDRLFDEMGLGPQHGTRALRLASPFDYRRNAELVVPAMRTSAKDAEAHTAEIIERCNAGLIDLNEGTLVLFASYKQMHAVAQGLSPELASRVLMQGEAPRPQLLAVHRARIEAGEGSVLFGVSSFSEGLDLPGPQCSHVIIAKLFFSVPDSPVERTRSEWLESLGRNPFVEISVPDASFKLIQAAGRLLRTETDTGRVTVLDRRLIETRYGREMLDSLPPFKRSIESKTRHAA